MSGPEEKQQEDVGVDQQHDDATDGDDDALPHKQLDHDEDELDDGDDDDFDPSQPLPPSRFFGGGGNLPGDNDKTEEEKEGQHQEYDGSYGNDGSGGDDDDGAGGGGGDGGDDGGDGHDPSIPSLDSLNAADALPVFAAHEVRVVDARVKAKERLLQKLIDEEEENVERVQIMSEHLKNVQAERVHSQQMLDAKDRDVQTEQHLKQLAEREAGRVTTDVSTLESSIRSTQDHLSTLQNNAFVANEKLEGFKQQMNWNQEELLQWSLAAKQKEEDREAILKYSKVDESKLKQLLLRNETLSRVEVERKQQLDEEITETQAVQIELDKTADEYRKQHLDKQKCITQWDESQKALLRRDEDIQRVAEQVAQLRQTLRSREHLVKEQSNFLEQQQTNNKQLNVAIGMYERVAEKTRSELQQAKSALIEFEDEVATQRNELEKAESELRTAKTTNQTLAQQKQERSQRLELLKVSVNEARKALDTEYSTKDNLADRAKQVEQLHKEHEKRLQQQNKTLQALKESMFKHSHELFQKRKQEADLIAEISGAQGTSRNLQQRIHELDQRSLKQQEMLYNIEFQVQQLERKVSHASGKRSLEETMLLQAQISALQDQLSQAKSQENIVANQVKRLHEDLRAAKRNYREVVEKRDALNDRIARITLENDSSDRELRQTLKEKEELVVQHDVLKLEVKRLRENLNALADQVLAAENRRAQLQLSMREREREVDLHSDVQKAEVKAAEDSRHALARDLKERQIKVEKLKKKYETIAAKMQHKNGEGTGGTESLDPSGMEDHSQAYYIIAAAQEREELQREGDALNSEIRKCETEVAALTNTQAMLQGRNQLHRAGNIKPDPEGTDAQLKASLEEQQRGALDRLYKQRAYLRELTADFEERRNILAQLLNSIGAAQQELVGAEQQLVATQRSVQDQTAQLSRATNNMHAKRSEYHKKFGLAPHEESPEELAMNLVEVRRKNDLLLGFLRDFAGKVSSEGAGAGGGHEVEEMQQVLEEVGINIMSRPVSAASSRASSSRSHRPDSAASSRPMSSRSTSSVSSNVAPGPVGGAFGVRSSRPSSSAGNGNGNGSGGAAGGIGGITGTVVLPSIKSPSSRGNSSRGARPQSRGM